MNGANGSSAGLILPKTNFVYTDQIFRAMLDQVNRAVAAGGGQIPVNDPASFMALALVMDKLAVIEERLAKIEKDVAPPNVTYTNKEFTSGSKP